MIFSLLSIIVPFLVPVVLTYFLFRFFLKKRIFFKGKQGVLGKIILLVEYFLIFGTVYSVFTYFVMDYMTFFDCSGTGCGALVVVGAIFVIAILPIALITFVVMGGMLHRAHKKWLSS